MAKDFFPVYVDDSDNEYDYVKDDESTQPSVTNCLAGCLPSSANLKALQDENADLENQIAYLKQKIEDLENGVVISPPNCFSVMDKITKGTNAMGNMNMNFLDGNKMLSAMGMEMEEEEEKSQMPDCDSCINTVSLPFVFAKAQCKNSSLKSEINILRMEYEELYNLKGNVVTNCMDGCTECFSGMAGAMAGGAAADAAFEYENPLNVSNLMGTSNIMGGSKDNEDDDDSNNEADGSMFCPSNAVKGLLGGAALGAAVEEEEEGGFFGMGGSNAAPTYSSYYNDNDDNETSLFGNPMQLLSGRAPSKTNNIMQDIFGKSIDEYSTEEPEDDESE